MGYKAPVTVPLQSLPSLWLEPALLTGQMPLKQQFLNVSMHQDHPKGLLTGTAAPPPLPGTQLLIECPEVGLRIHIPNQFPAVPRLLVWAPHSEMLCFQI